MERMADILARRESRISNAKHEKESQELKDCTFEPKISSYAQMQASGMVAALSAPVPERIPLDEHTLRLRQSADINAFADRMLIARLRQQETKEILETGVVHHGKQWSGETTKPLTPRFATADRAEGIPFDPRATVWPVNTTSFIPIMEPVPQQTSSSSSSPLMTSMSQSYSPRRFSNSIHLSSSPRGFAQPAYLTTLPPTAASPRYVQAQQSMLHPNDSASLSSQPGSRAAMELLQAAAEMSALNGEEQYDEEVVRNKAALLLEARGALIGELNQAQSSSSNLSNSPSRSKEPRFIVNSRPSTYFNAGSVTNGVPQYGTSRPSVLVDSIPLKNLYAVKP
jgi:hypothetical protein